MATLINGDGNPAVYAVEDADWYIGLLGGATRILNRGLKFAYHVEDINTFLMDDGLILTKEGRRIQLDANAQDEITIPNGVQGSTQYYIVGYHLYTDSLANQKCETFIQQMDNATDTITENTFYDGATEVYVSLYRITQTELVVTDVELLLPYDTTQAQDRASLALSLSDLRASFMDADTALSGRITTNTNNIANTKDIISNVEEGNTATQAYSIGDYVQYVNAGTTYFAKVLSPIAIGDTFTNGTNVDNSTVAEQLGAGTARTTLTPPTASGSYTYDGTEKTVVWSNYDPTKIEIQGTQSATNAGTYTCTAVLKDSFNYRWSDGTNAPVQVTWTIAKAASPMTLSTNTVKLRTGGEITVLTSGAVGIVTTSSDDTSVATASVVNTDQIKIEWQAVGTCTVTVNDSGDTNHNSGSLTIAVTCVALNIYGVEWAGTSTTSWTRTDDSALFTDPSPAVNNGNGSSPFDSLMPWSGMERVTDDDGGTLVKIPKFWYKWTVDGAKLKLQIADASNDGFSVAPAFMDRGDGSGERSEVYVGAYHCATTTYKSTTGVKPQTNLTRSSFRTNIHNLGTKIWQWDYAMLVTIWMLYLVEYADWNSQAVIGYGCGNGSSAEDAGLCDGMTYHTGTNAVNRTTYGHVRYRWIEDLWANVLEWCEGLYFNNADICAILNPANFSDSTGGTNVGTRPTTTGYTSAFSKSSVSGFDWLIYPSAQNGSDSSYVCDTNEGQTHTSILLLTVGGYYGRDQKYGLFYTSGTVAANFAAGVLGSRLMKLP